MSYNVGGIYIKVKKSITQQKVAELIINFYTEKGATINNKKVLDIEPLSIENKNNGQLGYAITPETDNWIAIYDSERYTANYFLAEYLHKKLKISVLIYTLGGATNFGYYKWFGKAENISVEDIEENNDEDGYGNTETYLEELALPHLFLYFNDLKPNNIKKEKFTILGFDNVTQEMYNPDSNNEDELEETSNNTKHYEKAVERNLKIGAKVEDELKNNSDNEDPIIIYSDTLKYDNARKGKEVIIREGYVVTFFCHKQFIKIAAGIQKIFEHWLSIIDPNILKWASIGPNSTEYKEFTKTTIDRCKAQIDPEKGGKKEISCFHICSDFIFSPAYSFRMIGNNDNDLQDFQYTCVEMQFPEDILKKMGVEIFVQFCIKIGELIPYDSGYASRCFNNNDNYYDNEKLFKLQELSKKYPALDIPNNFDNCLIGNKSVGAKWLTFIGESNIKKLGGIEKIKKQLDQTIEICIVGKGYLFRVVKEPVRDDRDKTLFNSLAKLLELITYIRDWEESINSI